MRRVAQSVVVLQSDPSLRSVLQDLLEDEGYSIRLADTLAEVQEAVATGVVDLVLADAWGPGYQILGDEEHAEIVALGRTVPLIMLTARAWAMHPSPPDFGTVMVVRKPMDINDLLADIGHAIQGGLDDTALIAAREAARRLLEPTPTDELAVVVITRRA
jgi:DNA-binding response OmpR family regulator